MSDAREAADIGLDELVARVSAMPVRLRSLRVVTRGWSDHDLSMAASDRARGLLARRLPRPADAPVRRSETRTASWMEFGEDAWGHPMIGVWPARWREEFDRTRSDGKRSRSVAARDHDTHWWDHGDGVKVTDARRLKTSLASAWVVGRFWADVSGERDLLGPSTALLGRQGVRVRVTPEPDARRPGGPFHAGDEYEITVDVDTGLTLALTSMFEGAPFHHDEVTELEIDATVDATLTATPRDAEPSPPSQRFRDVDEVAAATELSLLAARWLPAGYVFQSGAVYKTNDVPYASLVFARDGTDFVQLHEQPESLERGDEIYEWQEPTASRYHI